MIKFEEIWKHNKTIFLFVITTTRLKAFTKLLVCFSLVKLYEKVLMLK